LPFKNCHYYSKCKGNTIYSSACVIGLKQHIEIVENCVQLDVLPPSPSLILIIQAFVFDSGDVKLDAYNPPIVVDIYKSLQNSIHKHEFSYRKFVSVDYGLVYICVPSCENIDHFRTI
jgi:hypothetical protein